MDTYMKNLKEPGQEGLYGPAFIPQDLPRKLGIPRLIVLILMALVAGAEMLLLAGFCLASYFPGIIPL